MRRSPTLYTVVVVGALAIVAAGSAITGWFYAPAVRQVALAHQLTHATGANVEPYTKAAFAAAQASNDPILIAIHAKWCRTCAVQSQIIQQIAAQGDAKNLRVLLVDFDTQKDVVKQFGATMQSTLVVFRGKEEMARTVGDTDPDSIRATIRRTFI
jgi:thioredoxin-like negative regulator of GroEL